MTVLYTTASIKENFVRVCRQLFFCLPAFINIYKRDTNNLSIKTNQANTNLSWLQDVVSLLFPLAFWGCSWFCDRLASQMKIL